MSSFTITKTSGSPSDLWFTHFCYKFPINVGICKDKITTRLKVEKHIKDLENLNMDGIKIESKIAIEISTLD